MTEGIENVCALYLIIIILKKYTNFQRQFRYHQSLAKYIRNSILRKKCRIKCILNKIPVRYVLCYQQVFLVRK